MTTVCSEDLQNAEKKNSVDKYFVIDFNFHPKIFLLTPCNADYFGNVIHQLTNGKWLRLTSSRERFDAVLRGPIVARCHLREHRNNLFDRSVQTSIIYYILAKMNTGNIFFSNNKGNTILQI